MATQYAPALGGRPSASRAAKQTQRIAVLSHAEYVPTLTAAAAFMRYLDF